MSTKKTRRIALAMEELECSVAAVKRALDHVAPHDEAVAAARSVLADAVWLVTSLTGERPSW